MDIMLLPKSEGVGDRASLSAIVELVRQSAELDQILAAAVQEVRRYLSVDRVQLYRFDDRQNGEIAAEAIAGDVLPLLAGDPVSAAEMQPWLGSPPEFGTEDSPVRAANLLAVPIHNRRSPWGLLVARNREPQCFSESQQETVRAIADCISIAVAQASLLERSGQQARNEAIVTQISSLLHAPLDLALLGQQVLELAVRVLNGQGGRLYLRAQTSTQPAQLCAIGIQPDVPQLERTPSWRECAGEARNSDDGWSESLKDEIDREFANAELPIAIPRVRVVEDIDREETLAPLRPAFEVTPIRSLLIVPLQYQHRCLGYLSIFRYARVPEIQQPPYTSYLRQHSDVPPWRSEEIKLAKTIGLHLYLATMQRWVEQLVRHQASHDALTGLGNRCFFEQQLSQAIAQSELHQGMLAVVFLDLDGFKTINDTLGHAVGDRLLQEVAQRLRQSCRDGELLARWGGDEFIFLANTARSAEDATHLARRIMGALEAPFILGDRFAAFRRSDREFWVRASLGIALAPHDGRDVETLVKNADAAMYAAKREGGNQYCFYAPSLGMSASQQLFLENQLYKALDLDEFVLHYQPQIHIQTGKIIGVEALLRWQHPRLGLISPGSFIPVAEETGSIVPLGEWALRTACQQCKLWRDLGQPHLRVAVNLSPYQFQGRNLMVAIAQVLSDTQLPPSALELEITETAALRDIDSTIELLNQLREMGIKVAMDDFGKGYSSLWTLDRLPLDTLKIDRAFTSKILDDSRNLAIVKATVAMGHGLNLQVVAEGIESFQQWQCLHDITCDLAQGYYFSRPLSVDRLAPDQFAVLEDKWSHQAVRGSRFAVRS